MQKYADAAGLTKSIKVDGIQSSVGKFDFSGNDNQLAWSGVGQGQDTLCPINMLQYMGAIANGGKAAVPRLIEKSTTDYGLPTGIYYPHKSAQLIDEKDRRYHCGYDAQQRHRDLRSGSFPGHGYLCQVGHRRGRRG